MADNIGMGRLWAGIHWRSDHEAGLKLGQVVGCLVLRQLASICGGNFQLCPPAAPVRSQCNCDDLVRCSNAAPPPCDVLTELSRRCQDACAPCGESNVDVPSPCSPRSALPDSAVTEAATAEELDQRSVQQGGSTEQ